MFVISRLCRAATNGDLVGVKYLGTTANVNSKGWLGWSPLHKAAQNGHIEIVKYLCDNLNAMVDIRDLENFTPLLLAAGTNKETPGHVEVVKYLIQKEADVNATDDGQYTALHLAAVNSNFEIAQVLLEASCNVDPVNIDKFTPLHTACEQKNEKMVQLLINYGADPNLKDARGRSPLELARRAGIDIEPKQTITITEKESVYDSQQQQQPGDPLLPPHSGNNDPTIGADELLKEIAEETQTHTS